MKRKYCLQTVLYLGVKKKPSFAWRSFISAYYVLKNGLLWHAGDGRDLRIWGDKWLLTPIYMEDFSKNCEGSGTHISRYKVDCVSYGKRNAIIEA